MLSSINLGNRGQSEAIGVVILIAILMITLGTIGAIGGDVVLDAEARLDARVTEAQFKTLAAEASNVVSGGVSGASVPVSSRIGRSQGLVVVNESIGRVTVSVGDRLVYDDSIGIVEYREGSTTIAFQGGGVWKISDTEESAVLYPPSVSHTNISAPTVGFSLVNVTGNGTLSEEVVISLNYTHQPYSDIRVPAGDTVAIEIESEYYRAWGQYFSEDFGIEGYSVTYDNSNGLVRLEYRSNGPVFVHFTVHEMEIF